MDVIFLGKKPGASLALEFLIEQGFNVLFVCAILEDKRLHWHNPLKDTVKKHNIKIVSEDLIYEELQKVRGVDLVVSYLFWEKIKEPLITGPKYGCINFHPAPLPDFRGVGGYNIAIYEKLKEWGVSAHFVDQDFDTGDIIKVNRFPINSEELTAFSLEQTTQDYLLELFKEVMLEFKLKKSGVPRRKQGNGRYIDRSEFERIRRITNKDSQEEIERKIRAFWYPPYEGAYVEIDGRRYTLVNEFVLKEAAKYYHGSKRTG